ncbi:MAG TPA: hypothetical protein VM737_10115 [Gemmatimonadota bacterium]|nr:hypothetical protein [Gemmatimonadota bacterium]
MLGKFERPAAARAAVAPGQVPLDDQPRDQLQAAETGELGGRQERR